MGMRILMWLTTRRNAAIKSLPRITENGWIYCLPSPKSDALSYALEKVPGVDAGCPCH